MPTKSAYNALALVLLLLLLASIFAEPTLVNNGDFVRVTRGVIDTPIWSESSSCYAFSSGPRIPSSSMSAVFMLMAGAQKIIGLDCFHTKSSAYFLYLLLVVGAYLSIRHAKENYKIIIPAVFLALLFSPLMSSYYEEAVIFALVPWMVLGASQLKKDGRLLVFVVTSCLIVFSKAQMAFFVPLLICVLVVSGRRKDASRYQIALGVALIILFASAANFIKGGNSVLPNKYNRYFNGIGWSVQNVSTWPANNFSERHSFFYKNKDHLQKTSATLEPVPGKELLGTSYWPTGLEIFKGVPSIEAQASINGAIGFTSYLRQLSKPYVFLSFIKNTYLVFINSDYSLNYLRGKVEGSFQADTVALKNSVLGLLGFIYVPIVLLYLLRNEPSNLIIALYVLLMPLAIVAADGFYEFEKHMVTFLIASPLFLLLLGRRRFEEG